MGFVDKPYTALHELFGNAIVRDGLADHDTPILARKLRCCEQPFHPTIWPEAAQGYLRRLLFQAAAHLTLVSRGRLLVATVVHRQALRCPGLTSGFGDHRK